MHSRALQMKVLMKMNRETSRPDLDWLKRENAASDRVAESESRIADIERSFDTRFHALDYARKLYLIERCLHGVDIQPIAVQIAKLRCFISLAVMLAECSAGMIRMLAGPDRRVKG